MKFFSSLFLLSALGVAVQAKPSAVKSALNALMTQNLDGEINPDLASECFAYYLPMLSGIATIFSTDYQNCITVANAQIANLTAEAAQNRTQYQTQAQAVCSAFSACDNLNDTVSFFDCYSTASQNDVSIIYDISSSAANAANTLHEGIQQIQNEEYLCTNTTEDTYVRNTANTYDLLDSCLKNGLPATTATSTTPVSTTESNTSESTVSESVSTSSPDTTDATDSSASTISSTNDEISSTTTSVITTTTTAATTANRDSTTAEPESSTSSAATIAAMSSSSAPKVAPLTF